MGTHVVAWQTETYYNESSFTIKNKLMREVFSDMEFKDITRQNYDSFHDLMTNYLREAEDQYTEQLQKLD